ncbi:MAG: hypothetical protein ACRD0K_28065 [Egibacteraceae bacterium]
MTERSSNREGVLVVEFPGRPLITLQAGGPEFTFGRGRGRTLRFAHDTAGGQPDLEVSRYAGTVWWENGLWWVRNDSATRPFDIVTAQGVRIPLLPRSWSDSFLVWVPSPRMEIRIEGPYGPYVLMLTVNYDHRPRPLPEDGDDDMSTRRLPRVTARDRLLLAAKFLALAVPGEAIGDQEAADYANAALNESERRVTPKAVEDCVRKWRERFQGRGVTDIDGQRNINNLGRKLLAWGILHPEDRDLLRHRH